MENPRLEFEIEMNNKLSILQTYKDALENMVQIGGLWAVGQDKNIYHIEMPDKIHDTMWKHAKRYDIQTGEVIGYTNADRIRSMTDEELATVIALPYLASPPWCANHKTCPYISEDPTPCDKCALDWLREEVADG